MNDKKSFWGTLPGILTGGAAVISAVAGLLVALQTIGVFDQDKDLRDGRESIAAATEAEAPESEYEKTVPGPTTREPDLSGSERTDLGARKAVPELERASARKPGDAWPLRYLADAYQAEGKFDLALDKINESLRIAPDVAFAYKERALEEPVYSANGFCDLPRNLFECKPRRGYGLPCPGAILRESPGTRKTYAGKYGESNPLRQRGGGGYGHSLTLLSPSGRCLPVAVRP